MSRKVLTLAAALLIATGCIFSNGLSLNSIGTRSLGMGGSFIGLANDYTAIYWNPAGISQLKGNYLGLFSTDVVPTGSYKIPALGIDAKMKTNHYISPNLMGYVSFEPAKDFTFALGVYVPAEAGGFAQDIVNEQARLQVSVTDENFRTGFTAHSTHFEGHQLLQVVVALNMVHHNAHELPQTVQWRRGQVNSLEFTVENGPVFFKYRVKQAFLGAELLQNLRFAGIRGPRYGHGARTIEALIRKESFGGPDNSVPRKRRSLFC